MDPDTDTDAAVLVALRAAGAAGLDGLVDRTDRPEVAVRAALGRLEAAGWVRHRDLAPAGWSLTPEGRRRAEAQLAAAVADPDRCRRATEAYERFRRLNPALLSACTRWQVRHVDGVPVVNDHDDAAHDAAAVAELASVHADAGELLTELERVHAGFDGYRRRFDRAIEAVRAGDGSWFASPLVDSFHTAWFELHEHLLATLGLDRSSEQPAAGARGEPPTAAQQEESQ